MSFCIRWTLNAENTALLRSMAARKSSSGSTAFDLAKPFFAASLNLAHNSLNRLTSMSVAGWKSLL